MSRQYIQAATVMAVVCALVVVLLLLMDPFGVKARQKAKSAQWESKARHEALLRQNQTLVQDEIGQIQAQLQVRASAVRTNTETAIRQAMEDDDAAEKLGDDRHNRLVGHDRGLCLSAPEMDGCRG